MFNTDILSLVHKMVLYTNPYRNNGGRIIFNDFESIDNFFRECKKGKVKNITTKSDMQNSLERISKITGDLFPPYSAIEEFMTRYLLGNNSHVTSKKIGGEAAYGNISVAENGDTYFVKNILGKYGAIAEVYIYKLLGHFNMSPKIKVSIGKIPTEFMIASKDVKREGYTLLEDLKQDSDLCFDITSLAKLRLLINRTGIHDVVKNKGNLAINALGHLKVIDFEIGGFCDDDRNSSIYDIIYRNTEKNTLI